jgi:hypothetical protein
MLRFSGLDGWGTRIRTLSVHLGHHSDFSQQSADWPCFAEASGVFDMATTHDNETQL